MQLKKPSTDSLASSATAASTPDADSPSLSLSANPDTKQVLLSITPPNKPQSKSSKDAGKRSPLDICCVIDVSGSMGQEAPIPADPTTGAPAESTGLSVLDVVKHALRTIITTMQEDDRIALVTFSDKAEVVAGLTEMTDQGKSTVLSTIDRLVPLDCTNLWDGLKVGMDLIRGTSPSSSAKALVQKVTKGKLFGSKKAAPKAEPVTDEKKPSSSGRFSTIFILTDGMPNINPPRGHIPVLNAYLGALDNSHSFNINTFGFGYSLDSPLLLDIAKVGGGGYSFIPDSGIVGTVFVNAVANAYATFAPRVSVDVEVPEGTSVQVKGDFLVTRTSWGVKIAAGDLQFGQTMDLVLDLGDTPNTLSATLNYKPSASSEDSKVHATLSVDPSPDLAAIAYHAARLTFVEILWSVKQADLSSPTTSLQNLSKTITTSPVLANYADALALEKDISGEGMLALQTAPFARWGRHYLPSLARSHQRQQCGNFKDPGLQVYGRNSQAFNEERDKLDTAFMALPPPKPSVRPTHRGGSGASAPAPRALKSMGAYYSVSGPCFTGDCLVALSSGLFVRVDELKRGMTIKTLTGTNDIAAVLRTNIVSGQALLCRIGDLRITPWHPIVSKDTNQWVFPADVVSPELMPCEAVYSLLLHPTPNKGGEPNAHSVSIGGMWCVTLGHGLTAGNGDVRAHVFLGDYEKVLRELSRLDGFYGEEGIVQCVGTARHPVHGTITGFIGEEEFGVKSVDRCAQGVLCI